MSVNRLTNDKSQLWLNTSLDTLTKTDTLESHLTLFLISCQVNNLSPRSIRDYGQKLKPFITFCRGQEITNPKQITVNAIRLYLLGLQQRMKPISVHDYYRSTKRFLNWLVEESILDENPMARLHPPKVPKRIITPFSVEQVKRMLAVCNNTFAGYRDRAVVLVFIDTGLRLAELTGIMLSDVDMQNGVIQVMGKGAKQRRVRIGRETQKAVLKYMLRRTDALPCLWVTEERHAITAEGIRQIILRLGRRAGITGVRCSPHTFRHTFSIYALRCGMGEFALQHLLGHETLFMTRCYAGSLNDDDAIKAHEEAAPVDNMFKWHNKRGGMDFKVDVRQHE